MHPLLFITFDPWWEYVKTKSLPLDQAPPVKIVLVSPTVNSGEKEAQGIQEMWKIDMLARDQKTKQEPSHHLNEISAIHATECWCYCWHKAACLPSCTPCLTEAALLSTEAVLLSQCTQQGFIRNCYLLNKETISIVWALQLKQFHWVLHQRFMRKLSFKVLLFCHWTSGKVNNRI